MGTEYTDTNYIKYFSKIKYAKEYAEKEYKGKITWSTGKTKCTSGDLSFVQYNIYPIKITK